MSSTSLVLADPGCPLSFWQFAGAVTTGSIAGAGAAWLTRQALRDSHPVTQTTAATMAKVGAFWLIGGLTWIAIAKRA